MCWWNSSAVEMCWVCLCVRSNSNNFHIILPCAQAVCIQLLYSGAIKSLKTLRAK